ncbi:hypothetical protein QJT78_50390, partial [Bradyrhizobium sp. Mp27]|nr:hypothetical protein [Bradyrhizobium sp. Mp27]
LGHGVSLSSRGSGRLVTRLDTPPSSHRHHPDSAIAHGEEALAWHGRRITDVLITDVKLPGGIDGWQIAEHCRATLSDSAMNLAKLYQ